MKRYCFTTPSPFLNMAFINAGMDFFVRILLWKYSQKVEKYTCYFLKRFCITLNDDILVGNGELYGELSGSIFDYSSVWNCVFNNGSKNKFTYYFEFYIAFHFGMPVDFFHQ